MASTESERGYYNCSKCPAYCCSVYERVQVGRGDIKRLAKHFGLAYETAQQRFVKTYRTELILRQKADPIFGKACTFLDPTTRQCSVYSARPQACREYPDRARCAYYDLLQFERKQQNDETVLPLVQITFRNGNKHSN